MKLPSAICEKKIGHFYLSVILQGSVKGMPDYDYQILDTKKWEWYQNSGHDGDNSPSYYSAIPFLFEEMETEADVRSFIKKRKSNGPNSENKEDIMKRLTVLEAKRWAFVDLKKLQVVQTMKKTFKKGA